LVTKKYLSMIYTFQESMTAERFTKGIVILVVLSLVLIDAIVMSEIREDKLDKMSE
jgi:hypothetical protein